VYIDQVLNRFTTLATKGLAFRLNGGADARTVHEAEERFGVEFPEQVAQFWTAIDGLQVEDPPFELASLSEMLLDNGLLVFGRCDRHVRLAFDARSRNEADRWSIVNADTGYRITFTVASFWSSHMWTWLVKRRPIWYDVHSGMA